MPSVDWSSDFQRLQFENDLKAHRDIKKKYPWSQWLLWLSGIILMPAFLVLCFYGPVGYTIVNDQYKIDEEQAIKLKQSGAGQTNLTEGSDINVEDNDTILIIIKRNFYFLTIPCQGLAFLANVAFHFTNYKQWNLLGGTVACLCLPVDMLIFYIEPLGFVRTMGAMVLGFIPFGITMGDAIYPQREVKVMDTKGQIATIQKNSWTKHLSLSHNERYNFVLRMTASGYSFFATVALVITLFQGEQFLFVTICNEVFLIA